MYTKQLDNGILNSYAVELPLTYATYPTADEQNRYMTQGAIATLLVAATIITTLIVS